MERKSGLLMHITSLPSNYGIGTMGDEARRFVDFLSYSKQTYWQILPLCQTGFGNSPYQSCSTFAGNPYLIDLDYLYQDGLLKKKEYSQIKWTSKRNQVDYDIMFEHRYEVLRIAVKRFFSNNDLKEYDSFINNNTWIEDYSLFMALKHHQKERGLTKWRKEYKKRNEKTINNFIKKNQEEINFWKGVQFIFFKQWFSLKEFANKKGIKIIGDCPIYVSLDSSDVWANPSLFQLDEDLNPIKVAGCPPDYFNENGQLWGNPLYNWDNHKKQNYDWWIKRINHFSTIYDYVRIDHFRGLAGYYSVNAKEKTAKNGKWELGPDKTFIETILSKTNNKIIAENLGFMTFDVIDLLKYSGYPGMNVLEFGFSKYEFKDNENAPINIKQNSVAYIGTHDNEPLLGWVNTLNNEDYNFLKEYLGVHRKNEIQWKMIECLWSLKSDTVILQAQDLLGLGHKARMNTPSTTTGNWMWRCQRGSFRNELGNKLKQLTIKHKRA